MQASRSESSQSPVVHHEKARVIRVFTSCFLEPSGLLGKGEKQFTVETPAKPKLVILGNFEDRKAAKELELVEKKLSALGMNVIRSRRRWPRDDFHRSGDTMALAFDFGFYYSYWKLFLAALNGNRPVSAGEDGAVVEGRDFVLVSQAASHYAIGQLGYLQKRIHVAPAINGIPHIDCFLGIVPSKNILVVDPLYERKNGRLMRELIEKEGVRVLAIPQEEAERNPANFLLLEKDGREIVLMNHAPKTADELAKRGVEVEILDEPLKRLNRRGLEGLRCITNQAEEGLLQAIEEKARELFGGIDNDPRFRRLVELASSAQKGL